MSAELYLLELFLIFICLIALPVLAIVAFVRAGAAQKTAEQIPRLTSRIWELERQVKAMDQKLGALAAGNVRAGSDLHSGAGAPAARSEHAPSKPPEAFHTQAAPSSPTIAPPATAPPSPAHAVVTPPPQSSPLRAPTPLNSHSATPPAGATPPFQTPPVIDSKAPMPHSPPATPPLPPQPPHHVSGPPPGPPSQPEGETDVESMIAGRWFNYVGILAVGLAATFFLKYAFDNNWIGPGGRVTIGLLVGAAMYPLSQWVYNRGYQYYSEGMAGLGAGILYLSVWAGWHYYHIFPQVVCVSADDCDHGGDGGGGFGRNSRAHCGAGVALAGC